MRHFTILILSLLLSTIYSAAQNFPQYNHFAFEGMLYNPAVTGAQEAIEADLLYRSQWVGIEGQPKTIAAAVQSPINRLNSNLGLFFVHDRLGAEKNNYIQVSYAWRKRMKFASLALGISGGVIQKQLEGNVLRAPEGEYREVFSHNDAFIPENKVSAINADVNMGVYLSNERWYAGISLNNLLANTHKFTENTLETKIKGTRYTSISGGYSFRISKNIELQPNILILSDFLNYQGLYNLTLYYKQKIWIGTAFRGTSSNTKESIIPFLGFNIAKKVKLGYSYEAGISSLRNVNSGSHEIFVKYLIDIRKFIQSGKIIYNPRFL